MYVAAIRVAVVDVAVVVVDVCVLVCRVDANTVSCVVLVPVIAVADAVAVVC